MLMNGLFNRRAHVPVFVTGRQVTFIGRPSKSYGKIGVEQWGECYLTSGFGQSQKYSIYLITRTHKAPIETDYIEHISNLTHNNALMTIEELEGWLEKHAKGRSNVCMDYSNYEPNLPHYSKIPVHRVSSKNTLHQVADLFLTSASIVLTFLAGRQATGPILSDCPSKLQTHLIFDRTFGKGKNPSQTRCHFYEAERDEQTLLWSISEVTLTRIDRARSPLTTPLAGFHDMTHQQMTEIMTSLDNHDLREAKQTPKLHFILPPKTTYFRNYMLPIAEEILNSKPNGEPDIKPPQRRHFQGLSSRHP